LKISVHTIAAVAALGAAHFVLEEGVVAIHVLVVDT
jgi:hypothetical protein